MSLGGGVSSALDAAVVNSIAAGVTYAIAAGNSSANACLGSPARVAAALTVGATTTTDVRASFSNFGACLDVFAPGSGIGSAWYTSNTATNSLSGTSMATPHVAGAAALYLQTHTTATPAQVAQALLAQTTAGRVGDAGTGSPNRLLFTLFPTGGTADVTPPSIQLTQPASHSTVSSSVSFAANASDNSGIVTAVEFFVDGTRRGTDSSAPFAISWDTRTVSDGLHILTAKAYDASNNVGASGQLAVTVRNQTTALERVANGGFESGTTSWVLSGNAYFSNGGSAHSGTGYSVLGLYDNASGSRVPDDRDPVDGRRQPDVLAQRDLEREHDHRGPRPLLRGGPEHVGGPAQHARHLLQPPQDDRRRLHTALLERRFVQGTDRKGAVPRHDGRVASNGLPRGRRLPPLGAAPAWRGWAVSRTAHPLPHFLIHGAASPGACQAA